VARRRRSPDPAWWERFSDDQLASEGLADVKEICETLELKAPSSGYKLLDQRELPTLMVLSKRMTSRFALRRYSKRFMRPVA
jgi:hypothetical protein